MSNTNKPLIAVVGATGSQGGSVVQYLLNDPDHSFRIRALTRNVESAKTKKLAARGVEVVEADMNDVESLRKAFEGAYGVFGVTNFWDPTCKGRETQHGEALVDAALAADIKHFVWSTLPHTSDPEVPHWNSKALVDDYLKKKKVPRTSLYTAFFFENLLTFGFKKKEDGRILADWPILASDGPIGAISVAELGAYALEAFKKPQEYIGKDMRIMSDVFTPRKFIQAVREVTGKDVELREVDRAAFNSNEETNYELWSNMETFYKYNGNLNYDLKDALRINPSRKDMRAFVEANKEALLSAMGA